MFLYPVCKCKSYCHATQASRCLNLSQTIPTQISGWNCSVPQMGACVYVLCIPLLPMGSLANILSTPVFFLTEIFVCILRSQFLGVTCKSSSFFWKISINALLLVKFFSAILSKYNICYIFFLNVTWGLMKVFHMEWAFVRALPTLLEVLALGLLEWHLVTNCVEGLETRQSFSFGWEWIWQGIPDLHCYSYGKL